MNYSDRICKFIHVASNTFSTLLTQFSLFIVSTSLHPFHKDFHKTTQLPPPSAIAAACRCPGHLRPSCSALASCSFLVRLPFVLAAAGLTAIVASLPAWHRRRLLVRLLLQWRHRCWNYAFESGVFEPWLAAVIVAPLQLRN
jgi:hypothetical protein